MAEARAKMFYEGMPEIDVRRARILYRPKGAASRPWQATWVEEETGEASGN